MGDFTDQQKIVLWELVKLNFWIFFFIGASVQHFATPELSIKCESQFYPEINSTSNYLL